MDNPKPATNPPKEALTLPSLLEHRSNTGGYCFDRWSTVIHITICHQPCCDFIFFMSLRAREARMAISSLIHV